VRYQEGRGANVKATPPRLALIVKAMEQGGYTGSQLSTYLRWVFTAPARWPGWMRKPGHPYLEVENLLRASHLRDHLVEAVEWATAQGEEGEPPMVALYGDQTFAG
jgi:hypothetical protein